MEQRLEQKTHSEIDADEARELAMFDKMFGADKKRGTARELRERKINDYFNKVTEKYEQRREIPDSIVRLDQEGKIAEDLRDGNPILIRGNWRIGKTSIAESLKTHQFGATNSLLIDARIYIPHGESLEVFKKKFAISKISEFISQLESGDRLDEQKIEEQIKKSKKTPFEFINDYFSQKGEKVFLSIDEIVWFAQEPEKLKYLADLKNLSRVQVAPVLHRIALREVLFKETFSGRPLEVNNICYALMSAKSIFSEYKFTYRAKDIEKLAGIKIRHLKPYPSPFQDAIENYQRVYKNSMSDEERLIIEKLAKEDKIPISEINADKIQPLIDTTFVVKDDSKGVYRINEQLFKRVILNEE